MLYPDGYAYRLATGEAVRVDAAGAPVLSCEVLALDGRPLALAHPHVRDLRWLRFDEVTG